MTTKILVVVGCHGDKNHPACPFLSSVRTPGAGYALDYHCKAAGNKILNGYVEWDSEKRKSGDFPSFCPLYDNELDYKPTEISEILIKK